jgi:hypothetical protein
MAPLVAGAMLLAGGMAQAQDQTLVITEHSSTSLTAKFNGTDIPAADIANTASDFWVITLPGVSDTVSGESFWAEPGEKPPSMKSNRVDGSSVSFGTVIVFSDFGLPPINDDGTTDTTSFHIGTAPLDVTFTDNASASEVPDAAATLSLLSLSLAGLGILRKTFNPSAI